MILLYIRYKANSGRTTIRAFDVLRLDEHSGQQGVDLVSVNFYPNGERKIAHFDSVSEGEKVMAQIMATLAAGKQGYDLTK